MFAEKRGFAAVGPLTVCLVLLACSCASPPKAAVPETVPETVEAPPARDRFIDKLAALLEAGDIDGAIALFDTLSPEEAELRPNRRLRASVLVSAGRLEEARAVAEDLVNGDKSDVESRFILANIEGAYGRTKEQRRLLEEIVKDDPSHVPALNVLGQIFINAKSVSLAASYFDRALAADPLNMDAMHGRANVYRLVRKANEAEALLNKAVGLYPARSEPYSERGRFYRENGRLTEALSDLDTAKSLSPDSYWVSYDRGRVLLETGEKREALEEFDNASRLGPGIFIAYVYSAGIRDELGDVDGAERDYEMIVRLRPDYYFALEGLGIQKMKKGLYAEAARAFETAYNKASGENSYAMLAAINWLKGGGRNNELKAFVGQALRKLDRGRLDYHVMRLFYDFSGEMDVLRRVDQEKNQRVKAQMLFYLANYYDIRGEHLLADKFFIEFRDMKRLDLVEWRLNEWILKQRNIQFGGGGVTDHAAAVKKG
ncbi:MAG: tetratricopeptide repeat protein [Spirochaetaceae bacterium]|jgi:tetratricopeptide (TPR) repeat protein|nr:tetratricopeptide repeat protein [Spirochaetaceae bacterium]